MKLLLHDLFRVGMLLWRYSTSPFCKELVNTELKAIVVLCQEPNRHLYYRIWSLLPEILAMKKEYNLDEMPDTYIFTHSFTPVESSPSTDMFWETGWKKAAKPEWKSYIHKERICRSLHRQQPELRIKLRTLKHWGNNSSQCVIILYLIFFLCPFTWVNYLACLR